MEKWKVSGKMEDDTYEGGKEISWEIEGKVEIEGN